eukprot:TRINITY_DN15849_c0_g1_i4.p1 TRINITY_DN15849_c0_g1~~TRINITY_DN15849_c0_g1_i4.p1  ORF type:complete len:719 (+),score=64.81 TRINITY_DN15849_c0_g1_i4:90-2246(+)
MHKKIYAHGPRIMGGVQKIVNKWNEGGKTCQQTRKQALTFVSRNMSQITDIVCAERVLSKLNGLGFRNEPIQRQLVHRMLDIATKMTIRHKGEMHKHKHSLVQLGKMAAESKVLQFSEGISNLLLRPELLSLYTPRESDVVVKSLLILKVDQPAYKRFVQTQLITKNTISADILWAATKISVTRDRSLIQRYIDAFKDKDTAKRIDPSHAIRMMWCLTKSGVVLNYSMLEFLGIRSIKSGSVTPMDISQLSWCMVRLKYKDHELHSELERLYKNICDDPKTPDVVHSSLLWSFAHTRWYSKDLFDTLTRNYASHLNKTVISGSKEPLSSRVIVSAVNVLWAIQVTEHYYWAEATSLFMFLSDQVGRFSVQEVSLILSSIGGSNTGSRPLHKFASAHRNLLLKIINEIAQHPSKLRPIESLRLLTLMATNIIKLQAMSSGFMFALLDFFVFKKKDIHFMTKDISALPALLWVFATQRQTVSQRDRVMFFSEMVSLLKRIPADSTPIVFKIKVLWSYARVKLTEQLATDAVTLFVFQESIFSKLESLSILELSHVLLFISDFQKTGVDVEELVSLLFVHIRNKSKHMNHTQLSSVVMSLAKLEGKKVYSEHSDWMEDLTTKLVSQYKPDAVANLVPSFVTLRAKQDFVTKLLKQFDLSKFPPEAVIRVLTSLKSFSYSHHPTLLTLFQQAAVHHKTCTFKPDQLTSLQSVLREYQAILAA